MYRFAALILRDLIKHQVVENARNEGHSFSLATGFGQTYNLLALHLCKRVTVGCFRVERKGLSQCNQP